MPHRGIPTFDDIEQLAFSEPVLHRCYTHLRRGDITLDEFYRMCIVAYVEVNQKLRDELLLWFERSPVEHGEVVITTLEQAKQAATNFAGLVS